MSDKAFLKRTCLICGCHTNQTINIYEPRSGPNIVQLIQAKFKFQPLNDDKYLCFSCNNWLINWHSLQALNSNDAESPSGTFRSHLNNMAEEKGSGSHRSAACRPVAQVRPRQLAEAAATPSTEIDTAQTIDKQRLPVSMRQYAANTKRRNPLYSYPVNRRSRRRMQHKSLQICCMCGRAIIVRMHAAAAAASAPLNIQTAKCSKCRVVCKWRTLRKAKQAATLGSAAPTTPRLVNHHNSEISNQISQKIACNQSQQRLQRPLVDGKIVSMLRRLGTTLSRENSENCAGVSPVPAPEPLPPPPTRTTKATLPPIMSPAKQKPRWTRPLEDDEILLDFNTAISEVLPTIAEQVSPAAAKQTRRKLTYRVSVDLLDMSGSHTDENIIDFHTPHMHNILPKGLSVTLV